MRPVPLLLAAALLAGCGGPAPRAAEPAPEVVSQGVRLDVRSTGSGEDVLLLVHGGPGLSKEAMGAYEELAGDGLRVVSYDQRGAGASGAPRDGDYGLDAQVADLEAVRRATGAEQVAVLGQSWGGLVAMAYAAAHPERVQQLVLVGAAPPDLDAFVAGQDLFAARLAELQAAGVVPDPLPPPRDGSCAGLVAVLPVYAVEADDPPALPTGVRCTPSTSTATYEDALDPARLAEVRAGLQGWSGSALVVAGDQDVFGPVWAQTVAAVVPRAEQLLVPGAGHLVVADAPQAVLVAVQRLLDEP